MQQDPTRDKRFSGSELWNRQRYRPEYILRPERVPDSLNVDPGRKFYSHSLSGGERNRLFLRRGDNFKDVSLNSGADDLNDGRSFSMLDFDSDGWQDIALMSLNAPRFKLYRNQLSKVYPDRKSFRFRLEGGHAEPTAGTEFSNRDGVGAKVLITFSSDEKIMMHCQAGEGYASQNSRIKSIGLPSGISVKSVAVQWPSGKSSLIDNPEVNEILTIREKSDRDEN